MQVSSEQIFLAMANAARSHSRKAEVRAMLASPDDYALAVARSVALRDYPLSYREFDTTNSNGKRRHIEQPSLLTRVLQHLFIILVQPLYDARDPHVAFNCKKGYGIHARNPGTSLAHRLKSVVYSRTDLHYTLHIDQRHCYGHMTRRLFRRALKSLTDDTELVDFGVAVTFHGDLFPIGTPTSPLAHHIIMLDFDRWLGSIPGPKFRYADDVILFFRTREESNAAKWRIKNFWWYEYGVLAKRNPAIVDMDRCPVSFCGLVVHREGKYTRVRRNILERARACTSDKSWASYFGILKHTDSYKTMQSIEERMNFAKLTEKIKIDRAFDAEPIAIKELARTPFNLYDFSLRYAKGKDGKVMPNWVRLLVGVPEYVDGQPTGRELRYTAKTEAPAVVEFLARVKALIEAGEDVLPIEGCELENSMGYMFKGTTNRELYCTRGNRALPDGMKNAR